MTGSSSSAAPAVNSTAILSTNDAVREFNVFNITVTSLALCVLALTGLFFGISYHRRTRQQRRAREYENAVSGSSPRCKDSAPAARRRWGLLSRLRGPGATREDLGIYFIYSNPTPVEDEVGDLSMVEGAQSGLQGALARPDHIKDRSDGIILDPSMFYMQL